MELIKMRDVLNLPNTVIMFNTVKQGIPEWTNFSNSDIEAAASLYYLYNSNRYMSPQFLEILTLTSGNVEQAVQAAAGGFILRCGSNLNYLYKALFAEYNPIENYSLVESGTDVKEITNTKNDTSSMTNTGTTTTDLDIDVSGTATTTINKAGFNSASPVVDTTETTTSSNTTSNSETAEQSTTESRTGQSESAVDESLTHNFTRSGNIGVTTSQQMIESEITLRRTEYWGIVFDKINQLLTLSIY